MAGSDLRSARQLLTEELSRNPNSAEANYLMGNLLSQQKNYEEANDYFERSLNSSGLFKEHIDYLKEKNYREELDRGLDAWEEDNYEFTVRQLNLTRQIYPGRVELYPTLGSAYGELNDPENAQEAYKTCLAFDESNYECGLNLAYSYYDNDQFQDAILFVNDFLEVRGEDSVLLKILVYSHLEEGESEEAELAFSRFREIQNSYNELKQFAIELNNAGEIYKAEEYFRQCLERTPRDEDVLRALSYIYLDTGNYRLMVQANERLLSMDPENETLKKRLMLSYELYGDIDNYKAIKTELGLEE